MNYRAQTGVTYPILMNGHTVGIDVAYDCESAFVFVVGGDGIILYRGFYQDTEIRAAVDAGLAALAPAAVPDSRRATHQFDGGYPNPFNPSTRLVFSLDPQTTPQPARLEIIDLQGRVVRVLLDETVLTGRRYEAIWQGKDSVGRAMASGVYLARLRIGNWQATRFLTLVK